MPKLSEYGLKIWNGEITRAKERIEARIAELGQEVADHRSIEKGHLHLIAELKSQLKLKP